MARESKQDRADRRIADCGSYVVYSLSNGGMSVTPDWPEFSKWNATDGGGPGLGSRVRLAADLQQHLNRITRKHKVKR